MTSIDDFAIAARRFCDWSDTDAPSGTAKAEMLLARRYLSSLYAMALDLPEIDCGWADLELGHDAWKAVFQRFGVLPVGYYGSIFNPLEVPAEEAGLGDLADDLADIWRDLKEGLLLFDAGHRDAAGAKWQESFTTHWGRHAVQALSVIHFWLQQNQYRDE